MRRRIIAIAAAALLALVGVLAVVAYARGADQRAIAGARPLPVYITQKPVPAGTSLNEAMRNQLLVKTEVPAKAVPAGALTEVTDANKDLLAITDIAAGEYVLSARFGTTPQGSKAIQVPAGQVAISVALSDPARVGQFVTPGSRLVIYDTYQTPAPAAGGTAAPGAPVSPNGQGAKETRVLLDDVLVIAVGATALTPVGQPTGTSPQTPSAEAKTLVTLALPPDQATRLVHGIQTGQPYAGLRGADAKVNTAVAVSDASLFAK